MQNKLKSYDEATRALMRQAERYDIQFEGGVSLSEIVYRLRAAYKQKLTVKKVFNEIRSDTREPSTGFCAISSYYIYERTGGDAVWDFMQTPVHWWLRHKQTGEVFDVTYTQFNEPFPYEMGAIETRIHNDANFKNLLRQKAMILGRCAGME